MLTWLARKRVAVGGAYLLLVVLYAVPSAGRFWPGLLLGVFGEAVRTWASGTLRKNEALVMHGPYAWVRNPLYFGSFFLGWGVTWMAGNGWLILCFPVLFLPVYLRLITREEHFLQAEFPEQSPIYFRTVPRLLPGRRGPLPPQTGGWDLRRLMFVHREWGNWILLAAAAGWFYRGMCG